MKKLSTEYGKHLSLTNAHHKLIEDQETIFRIKDQDTVYNQELFSICDIIGNFDKAFIIIHSQGKLFMVDQHAASEKSLYVQFINNNNLFPVAFQGEPIALENIYKEVLLDRQQRLAELGWRYQIIHKGPIFCTVKLLQAPSLIGKISSSMDFIEIIEQLYLSEVQQYSQSQKESLASTACHTAIRFGHQLTLEQMRGLLDSMSMMDAAFNCPHGRPTIISLGAIYDSVKEIVSDDDYSLI